MTLIPNLQLQNASHLEKLSSNSHMNVSDRSGKDIETHKHNNTKKQTGSQLILGPSVGLFKLSQSDKTGQNTDRYNHSSSLFQI